MNYHSPETVPHNWNVGDVILDLYEVRPVTEGFGAASTQRGYHQGGFGRVYKVWHLGWNREMAVKVAREEAFTTPAQKEAFTRECESWVNLGLHMHIAACHYVRELGGVPRVFSEYAPAGTLQDWISSGRLYEGTEQEVLARILDISIQFAWGLHYAHERGFIHQDVKPLNALMWDDMTLKVSDFGLAGGRSKIGMSATTDANQSILVSSGAMTPAYCSPEQAAGEKLDRRTDIWSWAASVLQMFEGDITWSSGTAAGHALKFYQENQEKRDGIPEMPLAVAKVLQQCLQPNRENRPRAFSDCTKTLCNIFSIELGMQFYRDEPSLIEQTAESLNNRALSLLDLGRNKQALDVWNEACTFDSTASDPLYNLSLYKLRFDRDVRKTRAWIDDRFMDLEKDKNVLLLQAYLFIELGEYMTAKKCLQAISENERTRAVYNLEEIIDSISIYSAPLHTLSLPVTGGDFTRADTTWDRVLTNAGEGEPDSKCQLIDIHTGIPIKKWSYAEIRDATPDLQSVLTMTRSWNGNEKHYSLAVWNTEHNRITCSFDCQKELHSPVIASDGKVVYYSTNNQIKTVTITDKLPTVVAFFDIQYQMRIKLFESACLLLATGYDHSKASDQNPETILISTKSRKKIFSTPTVVSQALVLPLKQWLIASRLDIIDIYNIETQSLHFQLPGHTGTVSAMAKSNDEALLATASYDGTVRLWDLDRRMCRWVYEVSNKQGNIDSVVWVDISTDCQRLLAITRTGHVSEWRIPATAFQYTAPWRISRPASAVEIELITKEYDKAVLLSSEHRKVGNYKECVIGLSRARSLKGKYRERRAIEEWGGLYSFISKKRLTQIWEISQRRPFHASHSELSNIYYSEKYGYFCIVSTFRNIRVVNIPNLNTLRSFGLFSKASYNIYSVQILSENRIGIVWANDQGSISINILSIDSGEKEFDGNLEEDAAIDVVHFTSDGAYLVIRTDENLVYVICTENMAVQCTIEYPVASVYVSPNGMQFVTIPCNPPGELSRLPELWTITGQLVGQIEVVFDDLTMSVWFSSDSTKLYINSKMLSVFAIPELRLLRENNSPGRIVWIDPNGEYAALQADNSTVIYSIEADELIYTFPGPQEYRFSPDSRYALSSKTFRGQSALYCYFMDWELAPA